ncbi:urease accessory protein UreE [Nostoc sp. CENA67]|uniref:Urease accessory protein UreE n=1 Tax=Amazonocrinis nigriterrae CENA67 TaxID=2794033 RepID=A0A8J7HR18_9NOST|nr:urease accessory protein UreE [Amazonocrinis nigriterrae]MBH8560904.1 urease accessory protein UreE [Amazonocrinis nigriterrae CENA67]
MTELAQIYLGNSLENVSLSERIEKARSSALFLEVHISQTDNRKGRIHTHSTTGIAVGIVKNRDWSLREGDVLETEQGKLLLIHLQDEKVMVLTFTQPVTQHPIKLIHLGHVLGNHHWPIILQNNKLYVQLVADVEVIESTIHNFKIPGLKIDYELHSAQRHLDFSQHHHHEHHS